MRFSPLLLAAVPVFVSAATLTGQAALKLVPSVPDSAQSAYAMWRDDNGTLKPAGQLKAFHDAMEADLKVRSAAAMSGGQMQTAQQMQAEYGTPEGQAKLKNMSQAELMAMAMSMQQQSMAQGGIVSDHDQELVEKVNVYPESMEMEQAIQAVRADFVKLNDQWQGERQALDAKMRAEMEKLPQCPGEASAPPSDKMRDLELKYADLRIAGAGRYLGKAKGLEQRMRTTVAPRVAYSDQAMSAWVQLEGAGIKQMTSGSAQAAQQQAVGDASNVAAIVEESSRTAANEIVLRKRIVEQYKDIRPGCG